MLTLIQEYKHCTGHIGHRVAQKGRCIFSEVLPEGIDLLDHLESLRRPWELPRTTIHHEQALYPPAFRAETRVLAQNLAL